MQPIHWMNQCLHWLSVWHNVERVIGYYEAFFVFCLILGAISRRFRKFLERSVGDAILTVIVRFFDWFVIPIVHKITYLVRPSLYRKQILRSVEKEIRDSYKVKIKDYEYQLRILEEDRAKWKNACTDGNSDSAYWDGVKYGHALSEKNKSKFSKPLVSLTESHFFTMREIAGGNKTVNGLVATYLEDHGYVRLIWDDEKANKFHYEITEKGVAALKKNYERTRPGAVLD